MKIVFILNSLQIQRVVKRLNEISKYGKYNIEVYAFNRLDAGTGVLPTGFKYEIIGEFLNTDSYLRRFIIMYKSLLKLRKKIKEEKNLLYVFGLDVAIITSLLFKKKYIYEEADLVHTYVRNSFIRGIFEKIDKRIIKKSALSIFTSHGFIKYHFESLLYNNILVIPNKLNPSILKCDSLKKNKTLIKNLKIGFVGSLRFKSVYNFGKILLNDFPQHEFHVYGIMDKKGVFSEFFNYKNFFYHGPFKNPEMLCSIYSKLDLILSTYDREYLNIQFAEPNKLYEAIYFETPIIATRGTFLGDKVEKMKIGYTLDPLNETEVKTFISNLTLKDISEKIVNNSKIEKSYLIDDFSCLFKNIDKLIFY